MSQVIIRKSELILMLHPWDYEKLREILKQEFGIELEEMSRSPCG